MEKIASKHGCETSVSGSSFLQTSYPAQKRSSSDPAKLIIFNATVLVFNTQFLGFYTKFLVFNAKINIFTHDSHAPLSLRKVRTQNSGSRPSFEAG